MSSFRERLGQTKADTGKCRGAPQRPLGSKGFLVMLDGEPVKEILTWGPPSLWMLVRWSPIFLRSFLFIQEMVLL